jgi:lysophospholipase L1-like esterase
MSSDTAILYNLGIRGDQTKHLLHRLEYEYSLRGELRNQYPEAIILSVGINDSPRLGRPTGKLFTPKEEFQQQMQTLLEVAMRLSQVFFVGMTPVNQEKMPFLDCLYYNHSDQYYYKEITRQACLEREIPYLDIFETWHSRGEDWLRSKLCADGLHPNTDGHQAILEEVVNWEPIHALGRASISIPS